MTQSEKQAAHAASRITKTNGLQIHPIERGLFDVFDGEGWETHGRYRNYHGRWFHVSGQSFDKTRFPNIGK